MAEQSFLAHSGWVTEWIEKWGLKFPFKSGTSWKVKPRNHCVGYGFYIMSILSPRLIFTFDFLKHSPGSWRLNCHFSDLFEEAWKHFLLLNKGFKILIIYFGNKSDYVVFQEKELVEWEISLYKIKFNDR